MTACLLMAALGMAQALGQPSADAASLAEVLNTSWREARTDGVWRSPTGAERQVLQEVVTALAPQLDTCPAAAVSQARERLQSIDLALTPWPTDPGGQPAVLVIHEAQEHRGAGLYALRCGPAQELAWQAPHAFYDLRTRDITRLLFAEGDARALMFSTVHRYGSEEDESAEDAVHPADVTREDGSLFQAVTVALAAARPALSFVQIHGFESDSLPWDAVVSFGKRDETPTALAPRLAPILGRTAVYGRDVDTLGGTINVQGRALAAWPQPRFLHLELAPALRKHLQTDPELRQRLAAALQEKPW